VNRVFLIGDTHFGHSKIIDFEGDARPFKTIEEHDEKLMDLWNQTVKPKDTVWHLGDVGFGDGFFTILSKLNGLKKLVMGNHDRYPASRYLEHFSGLYGAVKLRDYILTHVPIHDSQFYRFKGNIHGHLHSNSLQDKRYINVSAEVIGLKPILFDEAVSSPQPTMTLPTNEST
jgi:calcineurin-like phosphoesterase family protein